MSSCHLRLRLGHVGGAHREATVIARTGEAPPDDEFRDPTYWYADASDCTDAAVRELIEWIPLLHLYKRRDSTLEVDGDKDLLDYYRERVSFG